MNEELSRLLFEEMKVLQKIFLRKLQTDTKPAHTCYAIKCVPFFFHNTFPLIRFSTINISA